MIESVARACARSGNASNASSHCVKTSVCSRFHRCDTRCRTAAHVDSLCLQKELHDLCGPMACRTSLAHDAMCEMREMRSSTRKRIVSRIDFCQCCRSIVKYSPPQIRDLRLNASFAQLQRIVASNECGGRRHMGDAFSTARDSDVVCRDSAHNFDFLHGFRLYPKPASAYTSKQGSLPERIRDCRASSAFLAAACFCTAFRGALLSRRWRYEPNTLPIVRDREVRIRHARGEASRHRTLVRWSFAANDSLEY